MLSMYRKSQSSSIRTPVKKSSQSPPQINHQCCYGCGDPLDVSVVSNPEPCHNQSVGELPQTLTSFHPICYSGDKNSFALDSTPNFANDSPNVFHSPPQPSMNYEFCGNDAYYSHDCPPQVPCIYNLEPCCNQDLNFPQNFQNVQQQYPCCESCGGPHENFQCRQVIFYEPCCENCGGPHETFQCQPMSYYEPNLCYESNYSSFDQSQPSQFSVIHQPPQETSVEILHDHENVVNSVQTFLRKFNRFSFLETPKVLLLAWDIVSNIKNAFGNKQYKPKDIHDDDDEDYTIAITPEEPDNSLNQFIEFSDSNDDFTLIDDDYLSIDNIDYVKATTPDSELVSLEEVDDDNLREKLLNINLLIAKIKSLNGNPTLDHSEPDPGELTSIVDTGIRENVLSTTNVNLPPEEDHSPLFTYVVWIFLSFLTYPVVLQNLLSFRNEDTIFDPGISNYHFPSLFPDASHRCETFMKFNVYPKLLLNESPMEILSSKLSPRTNEFGDWVKLSDPKQALRGRHPMLILVCSNE
nr:hypothetical protein [Tanacetum cinerariifolium]